MINMSEKVGIFPLEVVKPPKGLHVAMEGLAREVLKHNPSDIYKFAADYFEKLINLRKEFSLHGKSIGIQQIVKASLLNSSDSFSEKYMVYYTAAEEAKEQSDENNRIKRSVPNLEEEDKKTNLVVIKTDDVPKQAFSSKSLISPVKEVSEVLEVEESANNGTNENTLEIIENSQNLIEENKNTGDVTDFERDTDQDIVFIDNNEIVEPFAIHDRNLIAADKNNVPKVDSLETESENVNIEDIVNENDLREVDTITNEISNVNENTETDNFEEKELNTINSNINKNDIASEKIDSETIDYEGITNKATDAIIAPILEENIVVQRVGPLRCEIAPEEQLENGTTSSVNDVDIMDLVQHNETEKLKIDESITTDDDQKINLEVVSETKESPVYTETKLESNEIVNPEVETVNTFSKEVLKDDVVNSEQEKVEDQNAIIEEERNKIVSIEDSQIEEICQETEEKENFEENTDKLEELAHEDNDTRENNDNHNEEVDDTLENKVSNIDDEDDAIVIENFELLDQISNNADSSSIQIKFSNKDINNKNEVGLGSISDEVAQSKNTTENALNVEISHSDLNVDGKEQENEIQEEKENINDTESENENLNNVDGILSQTREFENKITVVNKDIIENIEETCDNERMSDRPEINEDLEHSQTKSQDFADLEDCSDLTVTGAQNTLANEDNNSVRLQSDLENGVSINQTEIFDEIVSMNNVDQIPVENIICVDTVDDTKVSQNNIEVNLSDECEKCIEINSHVSENMDATFLDVEKEIIDQIIEEADNQHDGTSAITDEDKIECKNIEIENKTNSDEIEPMIEKKTISSPLNREYRNQSGNDVTTELENIVESPNRNEISQHENDVKIPEAHDEFKEENIDDSNVCVSENDAKVEPISARKDFDIDETENKNAVESKNKVSQVQSQDIASTGIENIKGDNDVMTEFESIREMTNEIEHNDNSKDLTKIQRTSNGEDAALKELNENEEIEYVNKNLKEKKDSSKMDTPLDIVNDDSIPLDKSAEQYTSDDIMSKEETVMLNDEIKEQSEIDLIERNVEEIIGDEGYKNLKSDILKDEQSSEEGEGKNTKEQTDFVTDLEKINHENVDKNANLKSNEMKNDEENVSLIVSDVISKNENVIDNQIDQSVSKHVDLDFEKNNRITEEEGNELEKTVNDIHDENNISMRIHESLEEYTSNRIAENMNKEEYKTTQQDKKTDENLTSNVFEECQEQQYEEQNNHNVIKSEEISELNDIVEIEKVITANDDELSEHENIINTTNDNTMNSSLDEWENVVESKNVILKKIHEPENVDNINKINQVEDIEQVRNKEAECSEYLNDSISVNNRENVTELNITEQPTTLLYEETEGITNNKNTEESGSIIEETVENAMEQSTISDLTEEVNNREMKEDGNTMADVNKNDENLPEQSNVSVNELTVEINDAKNTEHSENIIQEPSLSFTNDTTILVNDCPEDENTTQKSEASSSIVEEDKKEIDGDIDEKTKNEISPDNGELILDNVDDSAATYVDVRNSLENSNITISATELSTNDNDVSDNYDDDINVKSVNEKADVDIETTNDEDVTLHHSKENTCEDINEPLELIETAHGNGEIVNFENTEEVVEIVSKNQIATLSERNFDTLTPIAETVINEENSAKSLNEENVDDIGLTNMEQIVEDFIALEKFHTEFVNSSLLRPETEPSNDSVDDQTNEFENETSDKITYENESSGHVEGFNIDKDSIVIQDIVSLNNFENNKIILILHAEINDNITKAKKAKRSISLQEHDRSENLLLSGPSVDDLILNKLTDEYHKYHDSVIANSTKKVDASDNDEKTDTPEENNIQKNIQVNFVNTTETIPPLMDDKITDTDENLFDLTEDLVSSSELSPSSDSQRGNASGINKSDQSIFEKASVVIQKVFRGFRVRKKIKNEENTVQSYENIEESIFEKIEEPILEVYTDSESINTDLKRRLNVLLKSTSYHSPIDSKLYTVSEERNVSSTDDESSTFSSAATKIQAGVRGFLTRKCFQRNKTGNSSDTTAPSIGEDSRSIEEYCTTSDLKSSTDDSISKIVVATSTILMEQLEQFDKIDSSPPAIPDINLTEVQKEANEEVLDRASQNRKRLRREDAIQLHSPFSSGETPVHTQPSKISEEDEQISELAQSIITEIESDNYTPVVRITQNEQNLSPGRTQINLGVSDEETRSDSDKGLEMEESHDHFQLTENEEFSDTEMPIYHETVKIPRMPTELNDSSNSDSNELVSPNVEQKRLQRKLPRYVSADVETLVSKHKEDADETDGVEEEQEDENVDVEAKRENNSDDVEIINAEDEKVVKILHSSEFHDTLVLPTKIIRKDAVQKEGRCLELNEEEKEIFGCQGCSKYLQKVENRLCYYDCLT